MLLAIRVVLVEARRLGAGLVFLLLMVSACAGGSGWAWTLFRLLAVAWLVALLCRRLWLHPVRPAPRLQSFLRGAEIIAVNVAVVLVLVEMLLRAWAASADAGWLAAPSAGGYRLVPGHDYGHGLHGNRLGFAGPDFATTKRTGVPRVVALGDSFAVGPAVAFDDNFLTLLGKREPEVEVVNCGISGAGPREYAETLHEHGWSFHPDFVLVCFFVGNDITETLPRPRDLDVRQFALYRFVSRAGRILHEKQAGAPGEATAAADRRNAGVMSAEVFREVEARRLAVCQIPLPRGMEKKWQRAFVALDRIIGDARGRQIPVGFVLIPDEFQVNSAVFGAALGTAGLTEEDVDLDLPQRRLRAYLDGQQVPCLDLLHAFQGVPEAYAPRDTHWNARGNHLAAEKIGAWLDGLLCGSMPPPVSSPPRPTP